MEFLDEESRPRLLLQSRARPPPLPELQALDIHKPSLLISFALSTSLFVLSLFFLQSEPLKSLVFWFALSLLLGPFAPSSLTGGHIRVGVGKVIEPLPGDSDLDLDDPKKKTPNRRSRARKHEELGFNPIPTIVDKSEKVENIGNSSQREGNYGDKSAIEGEEREWSDGDVELLKKLLVKHPVGKPRRWEVIAEVFQGRHGVESVIKMTKSMGEKKLNDADSFARFLKDRKPVDKRVEAGSEEVGGGDGVVRSGELKSENSEVSWSAGDDKALLNALKAFPKEVPMRWEKITAAVPGKSKAACMKRLADLKRDFRSSKASTDA